MRVAAARAAVVDAGGARRAHRAGSWVTATRGAGAASAAATVVATAGVPAMAECEAARTGAEVVEAAVEATGAAAAET